MHAGRRQRAAAAGGPEEIKKCLHCCSHRFKQDAVHVLSNRLAAQLQQLAVCSHRLGRCLRCRLCCILLLWWRSAGRCGTADPTISCTRRHCVPLPPSFLPRSLSCPCNGSSQQRLDLWLRVADPQPGL